MKPAAEAQKLWGAHGRELRDPLQICAQWEDANRVLRELLRYRTKGSFWEIVDSLKLTLLVSREYEHLLVALNAGGGRPRISYIRVPHPSGIAVDHSRGIVYVASTRNPNQIFEYAPVAGLIPRRDSVRCVDQLRSLVPIRSRFLPGSLYLHDLALIGGRLFANAVGHNAIVELGGRAEGYDRVWWPRSLEVLGQERFSLNYLQLNSIAAGRSLEASYFSASAAEPGKRRPGHLNFPVDHRGVIFSGRTRLPIAEGLTRPHSARIFRSSLYVDNSGYGEFGLVRNGGFTPLAKLPGWTRGLCFAGDYAFVATSRVIPRFERYAPGLDVQKSVCGVHAVNVRSGEIAGSLIWPGGNQIFSVDWIEQTQAAGFPFFAHKRFNASEKALFYTFQLKSKR